MKFLLAIPIIFILAATLVFGFRLVGCDSNGCGHDFSGWCLAERLGAASCPDGAGPLVRTDFHLNILKTFTTAIFADYSAYLALFFAAWLGLAALRIAAVSGLAFEEKSTPLYRPPVYQTSHYLSQRKFRRWLTLREKRDPALILRTAPA